MLCVVPSRHQSLWSYGCSWLDRSSATVFPASFPGSFPTCPPERERERWGGTSRRGPWEQGWKFRFSLVMRREKSSGGTNAWSLTSLLASLFKASLKQQRQRTRKHSELRIMNYNWLYILLTLLAESNWTLAIQNNRQVLKRSQQEQDGNWVEVAGWHRYRQRDSGSSEVNLDVKEPWGRVKSSTSEGRGWSLCDQSCIQ